ncbi:ribosome-inactivating protein [Nemania serpens]|nr:ribosome-inactivating protein [Nemania serpens]
MPIIIDFTETFNVDDGPGEYELLIERIRDQLAGERRSACLSVRVLAAQAQPPTNWFDIVLIAGEQTVRLRIRSDNLYLDAYQQGDALTGQWFEFGDAPEITTGATRLAFEGSYHGIEGVAQISRREVALGQSQLNNAIQSLGRGPTDERERARRLLVLIQMISESIRFTEISELLTARWWVETYAEGRMANLQNSWRAISGAVLQANPNQTDEPLHIGNNDLGINTARAASLVLGIMVCRTLPGSSRTRRSTMPETSQNPFDIPKGREMVEVFSLCIDANSSEDPLDLYGTVIAEDGLGRQYIYNRDRSNPESVHRKEAALLTGPYQAIEAADSFGLIVDLMDKDVVSPDDYIAQGTMYWNAYNIYNTYDKAQTQTIEGVDGTATLNYVVLSDAAQAKIEIDMMDGDGEDPANVYGTIKANNGHGYSDLFQKPKGSRVDVNEGDPIPLSRSVIAVPTTGVLTIEAVLFDYDSLSPDDEIANGKAVFEPNIGYSSEPQTIEGEYGKIQVKVTWS